MTNRTIKRILGTKVIQPPKPPAPRPPLKWAKKNCPKGNHVFGIYYNYEGTELVYKEGDRYVNKYYDIILDSDFHPFNCCPYCGRRVDKIIKAARKQKESKRDQQNITRKAD